VKAARSVCKNPLESLSLQQESSSGGIESWKVQRKDEGRSHLAETKLRRKGCQVIWPGVFENLNGWLSFSEGETPIFRGPLDPVDQRGG
jgi:hypothetical protein